MNEFEYKSFIEKKKMALDELSVYYQQLRLYESKNSLNRVDTKIQIRIFALIRFITKINRILEHRALKVLNDKSFYTKGPKIYVCQRSTYSIETLIEKIPDYFSMTTNSGNELSYIEHLLLTNGNLRLKSSSNTIDNKIIKTSQINNLLNNGVEVIFSESWYAPFVESLTDDAASLVVETGATIIPVATDDFKVGDKTVSVINIGKNLYIGTNKPEHIKEITKIVRIDLENLEDEILKEKEYGNAQRLYKRP